MGEEVLKNTVDDAVATITLARPDSMNFFNRQLRADLLRPVQKAEADDAVRVVILTGEGRGFCAGADLSEGLGGRVDEMLLNEYKPFLVAIAQSSKIFIASVGGAAAGIGSALAMCCDLVFMSDDAYVYLAFAAIGLIPDGGATWHLVHAMGYRRAFETIVEGRKVPAEECLSLGMANAVVARDELGSYSMDRANKLAAGAPLAQSSAKRILRQVGAMSMEEAIGLEAREQVALTESEDFANAVEAFFEKRKPVFAGK